jgi:shikimate kinase
MKNIVLTGFMGAGKTAVGRELSHLLGWKIIDVDEEIVKAQGMTINELFGKFGEAGFRDIETEMIRKVSRNRNVIISTGGGAVLRQENMDILREHGTIVCLWASADTVFKRTNSNSERPLLRVENPRRRIEELLEYRRPFYEKADMVLDTEEKTPLHIAEEILKRMGCRR